MNTARSALSNIMTPDSSLSFGNNPLVKRLLRGMFNIQPSIPKHVNTYDVDVVLQYLKGLDDADAIPFKLLTFRLVTLFCLLCPVFNTQQYLFKSFSPRGPRVNCLFVTHFLIN